MLEKFHGQRSLAGYSPRSHSLTPLNENTHSQNRDVLSKAHFIPHLVSSQVVEGGERQAEKAQTRRQVLRQKKGNRKDGGCRLAGTESRNEAEGRRKRRTR